MFADLVNKIACRIFAIFFFFLGVFSVLCGAVGLYWTFGGVPPDIAAEMTKAIEAALPPNFLALLSGGFIVLGFVFIALGVFAWSRHIWALIVGSGISVLTAGGSSGDADATPAIVAAVLVLLTIVAALASWRSRAKPSV